MATNKQIRKSQFITQFGIGAIVEIGNESLIGADLSKRPWSTEFDKKKYRLDPIPRLTKILKIQKIVSPPTKPSGFFGANDSRRSVPYTRFPAWLICRKCDSLRKYKGVDAQNPTPNCLNKDCEANFENLQPVRFIFAEPSGYLYDIEWDYLLHLDSQDNCIDNKNLFLKTKSNKGGGLSSLVLSCGKCKKEKSLSEIKANVHRQRKKDAPNFHPWQNQHDAQFNPKVKNLSTGKHEYFQQFGSSSLYQAKLISAIDLIGSTFEEDYEDMSSQEQWLDEQDAIIQLKNSIELLDGDQSAIETIINNQAKKLNKRKPNSMDEITPELLKSLLGPDIEEIPPEIDPNDVTDNTLLFPEWQLLNTEGKSTFKNYVGEKNDVSDSILKNLISSVTQVRKLREVRVLYGYTRYFATDIHPLYLGPSDRRPSYLPGIEVFGEGIYIEFNKQAIEDWKNNQGHALEERLSSMQKRQSELDNRFPIATPEFVMVHTFSHLLMNQLCFESGYGMSSVREKIYVDLSKGMCGVLIYTADSDSEGALGGLVRMGEESRIMHSVRAMIDSARWCSADPACLEIGSPGMGGINKSACHSCCLISETSCIHFNGLLDRGLIVGSDEENLKGYFDLLIE